MRCCGALRKHVLALCTLGAFTLALFPTHPSAGVGSPAYPQSLEIVLQVNDTIVSPLDSEYQLSVFLTNVNQQVAGIQITLLAGVSGLVRLPDSTRLETTIVCIDTIDCDPADTVVDTLPISPVDLAGSAVADWDLVQARALSSHTFRFVAIADLPGGGTPAPIPTGGPHFLFRMLMEREATQAVLDTLQDRTVPWLVTLPTEFSDPNANSIGLQESTICLNPPTCDSLDTVNYYDPTINLYVDGAVTFGPSCTRGDVNGDGMIDASDVIFLVNYAFKTGPQPACGGTSGDVDCSGDVSAADVIYMVNHVFKAGPPPCAG